ncbi:MAG TPA: hypothetical protein VIK53_04835, partial [Verrucomicrobiae bacterium]
MKFNTFIMGLAASLSLLASSAIPAFAQAGTAGQVYTGTASYNALAGTPINCQLVTTNLPGANLVTNIVHQGAILGVGVGYCGGASTNTGTVGFQFDLIYGTNSMTTTSHPFTATSKANGTTAVVDWFVFPNTTLGPLTKVVLDTITNAAVNVNGS